MLLIAFSMALINRRMTVNDELERYYFSIYLDELSQGSWLSG
jgi:hypothetical protein